MAKTRKRKAARRAQRKAVLVWVRLPKNTTMTVKGARRSPMLKKLLRDAGKNPQAACFGGDTCIV